MKEKIHCRMLVPLIWDKLIPNNAIARKVFLIMRLTTIILLAINLHISAGTFAQNISIKKSNVSLQEVFREIREQAGYYFIYNNELVSTLSPVSINVRNATINTALSQLFEHQPLEYAIDNKVIIISAKQRVKQIKISKRITGKVIDATDGQPLIGVTVKVKGHTGGAVTDINGEFVLNIEPTDQILQISYIGYATKEISITSDNIYNISLELDSKMLNEVVVAFGSSTKRELTNSVSQITAKDIEQRPLNNLNSALVGAMPGVQTTAGSGQPGEGPQISIRGFGSVTGSNTPLYIIDGAPYEGEINNINPYDIESISALKDAASTALYGARGANGIVLITTKKGKRNTNDINVQATSALSERGLPDYEKVNAYQYFPLMWESLVNGSAGNPRDASLDLIRVTGWNPFNVANSEVVLYDGSLNPDAKLLYPEDLSFKNELQRLGIRNDFTVSLSGGSEKADHYISLNYLDDQGYVIGSDFKRFSGRARVNAQPRKWLNTGLNLYANFTKSDQANESSGINENPFYVDLLLAPIYPVHMHNPITGAYMLDKDGYRRYDNGDYRPLMTGRNIVAETLYNLNRIKRNSYTANSNIDILFLKDFKFTTTFSGTISNYRNHSFDNRIIGDAIGTGRATRTNTMTGMVNFNQLLNYTKKIGRHDVKALLGHENYMNYYDYLSGGKRGMGVDGTAVLDNFTTITGLSSYDRFYKTEGYLAKLDYNFDGRYMFSASFRRDGSSKFAPDRRWGNFYAVSGAWNIDREKFFDVSWVDLLKVRASYGEVGNDNIDDYFAYQGLYDLNYSNGTEAGAIYSKARTEGLVWETNSSSDVALEFELFKRRLSGTLEVYSRRSKNLLFEVSLPVTSGLLTKNINFGSMRNRGIEVQLNGDIIKSKNFSWNMGLNWSVLDNKILSLPTEYQNRISGNHIYTEGRSLHEFWVRKFYGIDPTTGSELYYATDKQNASGRVIIGTDTLTTSGATGNVEFHYAGSAIPDFFGSLNNVFTYKNFSLQLMFLYQVGGAVFDRDYFSLMQRGSAGRALHVDALKRWQKYGDVTNVPARTTTYTMYANDNFITNASYLNLRTASLTYRLPNKFLTKYGIRNAKVFVNGENLFITSARKGMDPTQTYQGDPSYTYAPSRIVSFGLNFTL